MERKDKKHNFVKENQKQNYTSLLNIRFGEKFLTEIE